MMASCRSCVALQIVSKARNRAVELLVAVAVAHGAAEHLADLQRLRAQHRRLVGAADPLEMQVGIEPGGDGALEGRQEAARAMPPPRM